MAGHGPVVDAPFPKLLMWPPSLKLRWLDFFFMNTRGRRKSNLRASAACLAPRARRPKMMELEAASLLVVMVCLPEPFPHVSRAVAGLLSGLLVTDMAYTCSICVNASP